MILKKLQMGFMVDMGDSLLIFGFWHYFFGGVVV